MSRGTSYLALFALQVVGLTSILMLRGNVEEYRFWAGFSFYSMWMVLMWGGIGFVERWWERRRKR